jgi:hypothetical protein
MTSQLELNLRAALCRQLAKCEPANRAIWVAEAENWLRPSKEKLRGEAGAKIGSGMTPVCDPSMQPKRLGSTANGS